MPVIEVEHLTKEYRLGALQGLKQTLLNAGARLSGRPVQEPPLFKALDDVSFSIEQGEVVGIIGHNGAGKSTLLKMLARISTPTRGSVKVNGRIAPLIEVGAGFVPDFTGRENVYLNGSILGLSKKEIDRKFDEIVDFAEMAEFIDTPVKRYSSGMQVKLAFAVATSIEAEILIVDEVLAVGDLAFQRKCFDRMDDLIKRQGRTVLLVSHNIRQVERLCSRVILMNHGCVLADDISERVCNLYYEQSDSKILNNINSQPTTQIESLNSSGELRLVDISIIDEEDKPTTQVFYKKPYTIRIRFIVMSSLNGITIGIGAHTPDLLYVTNDDSFLSFHENWQWPPGAVDINYHIKSFPLYPGTYALRVGVALAASDRVVFYGENLCHFQVLSEDESRSRTIGQGFFCFGGNWRTEVRPENSIEVNHSA